MTKNTKAIATLCILIGACCWGTTGFFVNILAKHGLNPMQIASVRIATGTILFLVYTLLTDKNAFKINFIDLWLFVGTGILSLSVFNWSSFSAIALSSMSIASALLYTSPIFVLILAAIFFKEPLTPRKIGAVICTFCGCALVSGIFEGAEARITTQAIFYGLISGLAYALYSIFAFFALRRYKPTTVILYTFILSSLALLPISDMSAVSDILFEGNILLFCLLFGLIATVLPYLLYTKGLQHTEASRAATLATTEPIVASIIGVFYFHDSLTPVKITGIAMILSAVLLISLKTNKNK